MMKNTLLKYLLLCIFFITISEIFKYTLNFKELQYNSLAEKLTVSQIDSYFKLQDDWKWVGFAFIPIYFIIKFYIITSTLYIGIFFLSKIDTKFNELLEIVVKTEFIFLLSPIVKIVWFYFFQTNYNLQDLQYFFPFSAINITGYNGLEPWLIYPLQTLNLFEVAYIIYLSYQIGHLTKTNADNGFKIVGYSYLPALLLWVTVVMFFTLNYS